MIQRRVLARGADNVRLDQLHVATRHLERRMPEHQLQLELAHARPDRGHRGRVAESVRVTWLDAGDVV